MMIVAILFLTFIVAHQHNSCAHANTFLWDPANPSHMDYSWRRSFTNGPTVCVDIPSNLTLCNGIRYNKMRLPNLLQHDSVNEIIEQSNSWVHLVGLKCHPDTQLFLCSLFSPVCLEQIIPPCRSLCEEVKGKCEAYMQNHGYSWPPMMRCEQFPVDNNMCIQSQTAQAASSSSHGHHGQQPHHHRGQHHHHHSQQHHHNHPDSSSIDQTETGQRRRPTAPSKEPEIIDPKLYSSLLESVCTADWVIKSPINGNLEVAQSVRIKNYKTLFGRFEFQKPLVLALNQSAVEINSGQESSDPNGRRIPRKQRYILIGKGQEGDLSITRIVAWTPYSNLLKKTVKNAKRGDCSKLLEERSHQQKLQQSTDESTRTPNRNKNRNPNRRKQNRRNQNRTQRPPTTPTTLATTLTP